MMIEFLGLLFLSFISFFKHTRRLAAENIALRHQVSILKQKYPEVSWFPTQTEFAEPVTQAL